MSDSNVASGNGMLMGERLSIKLSFDAGTLVLEGVGEDDFYRVFPNGPWMWDRRTRGWRTEAIFYSEVVAQMRAAGWEFDNGVRHWQRVNWHRVELPVLRKEQQDAFRAWHETHRGVVVMPTGTGKTEVALAAMEQTSVSTLVVSPVRDLMYQWHRRILQRLGYDSGIIGDSVFQVRPVSVTTYDSACIHMDKFGDRFALIIFDECHHLPGRVRSDAALMSCAPWRLGLTATFERADGKHVELENLIGPVVYNLPIDAVRGKSLADYTIVRIPVRLSDEEQARYDSLSLIVREYMQRRRETDPSFTWEDLCKEYGREPESRRAMLAFRQKQAIEDRAEEKLNILEDLFRLHAGTPMVIFAGSNAMAREVSRRFLVPCLLNHCGKQERLEVLNGIQDGSYPALVANQVLDEGVDLPAVKVAVVIGGMASTKQAQQRLGRILRRQGDQIAVLYEVVCADTNEEKRSRRRRANSAYAGTKHRRSKKTNKPQ